MKKGGGKSKGKSKGKQQQQLLRKGSVVEVTSDEQGFKGVWFLATLLQFPSSSSSSSSSSNHPKAYVQYHTLVSDHDSSKPLRENVSLHHIRPPPPPDRSPEPFQPGHLVDAYYQEGWWTGLITATIPHLLSFVVTFPNPPDERVFAQSALRFHRQWVNGKWVHPAKQSTAGLMFSAGKKVEVSFDRLCDCWFPSTVLDDTGNGCYLVEYETIKGSRTDPVKATVDSSHIRPCPPRLKDNLFSLRDKVDASFDSAWWHGTIIQELSNRNYVVHIKFSNKERRFSHAELRPHLEWTDGSWYKDDTKDIPKPSDLVGTSVKNPEITDPHSNPAQNNNSKQKTIFRLNLNESDPSHTDVEAPRGTASVTSIREKVRGSASITPPSLVVNPARSLAEKVKIRGFTSPAAGHTMGGDLPSSHVFGKRSKRKRKENHDDDTPVSGRTGGSFKKMPVKSSINPGGVKEANGFGVSDEDAEENCIAKQASLPVIIGLECDKTSNSTAKKFNRLSGEELVHVEVQDGAGDIEPSKLKDGDETTPEKLKRRRGRPRKVEMKSPLSGSTKDGRVDKLLEKVISFDTGSLKDVEIKSADLDFSLPNKDFLTNGSGRKLSVDQGKHENKFNTVALSQPRKPSETADEALRQQMRSSKRGRKRTVNVNLVSQLQDSPHASSGKPVEFNSKAKQVEISSDKKPAKAFEDQPLSQWFQEMLPPTNAASKTSPATNAEPSDVASNGHNAAVGIEGQASPATNVVPSDVASTGQNAAVGNEVQASPAVNADPSDLVSNREIAAVGTKGQTSPAIHAGPSDVVSNGQNAADRVVGNEGRIWPFVKTSVLWSTVESMEAFQKLPQKPHFRPLVQCEESGREGRAIGCIVNFCSVVERASKLGVDEPKSSISGLLETLLELEEHGFSVGVVRDRITGVLAMIQKQEKLKEKIEEVKAEIEKQSVESGKIDEEMDELKQQMKALEEKLSEAKSRKEGKSVEMDLLRSKMEEMREGIRGVERDFESAAAFLC